MVRKITLSAIVILMASKLFALNYYWVGGSGNWSDYSHHWATSSGGNTFHNQVPQSTDNVFFNAASFTVAGQTVTVDQTIVQCGDMNWTGVTHNPIFSGSTTIQIYGSLTLGTGMIFNFNGVVSLEATTAGKTITTSGTQINTSLIFNGIGGGWTLQDALTCQYYIFLNNGTLNTNSKTVTAYAFISNTSSTRALITGVSIFNLTVNSGQAWYVTSSGMTLNASTSTINITGSSSLDFIGGGFVYNNISFTQTNGTGKIVDNGNIINDISFAGDGYLQGGSFHNVTFNGNAIFYGPNTCNNVTIAKQGDIFGSNTFNNLTFSPGYTYTLEALQTQTILNSFTVNGNCGALIGIVKSSAIGSQATISKSSGTVTVSYVTLKDINATGGAAFTANNAIDLGNNTGWTINPLPSKNLYWIGNGGNWNDGNHWSLTSGGAPSGCSPTPVDNALFDANSFSLAGQTVTVNIPTAYCNNMTWTGTTHNPTFTGSTELKIYGSLALATGMTFNFGGVVSFESTTTGKTITTSGTLVNTSLIFNGIGGGWTLLDALNCQYYIYLNNGSLNTNNKTVTAYGFTSATSNTRALSTGSSIFNLSGSYSSIWNINSIGINLNASTSTINFTGIGSVDFVGGGFPYNNISFSSSTSTGKIVDNGNIINDVSFAGDGYLQGGSFHNVTFNGNAVLYGPNTCNNVTIAKQGDIFGSNTFNNLTFSPGYIYTLEALQTQTILNSFNVNGNCGALIGIVKSSAIGSQATISKSSGAVTVSYVTLKDINATGGATFTANNAIDLGNNTGWTINTLPSKNLYWVGNSGNWNDGNHWSLTSGGSPSGCSPTPVDNALFDANSFSLVGQTVTVNIPTAYCNNMTWTGATHNPTFTGSTELKIYGSLALATGMTFNFGGVVSFESTTTGKTITTSGTLVNTSLIFNGIGGGWTLLDALNCQYYIYLNNGSLNTNNQTVTAYGFTSATSNTRALTLGSSVINLTYTNVAWNINPTGMTMNAAASTINFINTTSGITEFDGGGFTYNDISFTGTSSYGRINSSNSVIHNVNFASDGDIFNYTTFNNVQFSGNGTIYEGNSFNNLTFVQQGNINGNNTFTNLTFSPGYTYSLGAGLTQTVGNLCATGTGALPIRIQSSSVGTQTTISKASGTMCWDYVRISDLNATGGATFDAGLAPAHSQDLGNNTGFVFAGTCTPVSCAPCNAPVVTVQPSNATICSGTNTAYSVVATGTGLNYQWQVNTGSGYVNLTNTSPYSGVTTNTLSITNATNGLNGYSYRCIVSVTCGATVTSNGALLTINSAPTVTVNSATTCAGQPVLLTASGATTYSWSTGATTSSLSVSPNTTTSYTVTGTSSGCSSSSVATVTVYPLPIISATASSSTVTVSATGGTPPYTGTGTFTGVSPGVYSYTVTDANGCSASTSVTVTSDDRSSSQSNGPAIEWQNISWQDEDVNDNYQEQVQSGEDWWYSHKNVYNNSGTQTGYATVGYTSLVLRSEADFIKAQQLFNDGAGSFYNPINHDIITVASGGCTTPLSYMKYDFSCNLPERCHDRDYIGEHRTPTRGNAALNDLAGNMLWCKAYCTGELGEVIQDGNYFYIVGVHEGVTSYEQHAILNYNPTSSAPQHFLGQPSLGDFKIRHMYIAKIDMNGAIIWQGLYGAANYSNPSVAMQSISYGYDIIKSSNGKLVASGYAQPSIGSPFQPFVVELDPITGYVTNKTLLPVASVVSATGSSSVVGESHSLVEIGTSGNYAVACAYGFNNGLGFDDNEAAVWCIGSNLSPSTSWSTNPVHFAGTGIGGYKNSNIWEIKYHQAKQELLIPVVSDCEFCASAGNNSAYGKIYRYKNNGTPSTTGINPSDIGSIRAYDLRIGVEETSDGGFVSVSSRRSVTNTPAVISPPTSTQLGYLSGCPDISSDYPIWDTDPVVTKFDVSSNLTWQKSFDIAPNRPREQPLGDLKQQECLYKISQAQDGGYVVSGNCSYNFDDNYLFKLYNDCNLNQTYDVTDPTNIITIASNTTWNSNKSVLGSVHVKNGAILTITGASTVIQFADSKLTGILTNIVVEKGGKLVVQNGATLTSISPQTCPNSMWDGIIIEGTSLKQLAINQGWAVLSSSCKLQNARTAVLVGGGTVPNEGAILHASNTTFRNNYTDVEFKPYTAPLNTAGNEPNNSSRFSSCTFIGDALLNDPSYTLIFGGRLTSNRHVILRQVKGITFTGNNFKTDLTALGSNFSTLARSCGIYSIDATFNVHPDCSIINAGTGECAGAKNNFENLYQGIYAHSTNPLKSFTVNQTNFTNCYASLYQGGINYSSVTKNTFLINTTIPAPQYPLCLGGACPNYFHYANQCSGFTHQENTYTVASGITQQTIGTLFNATGTAYNLSYHNTYTGLKFGTQTQQTNGINSTNTGLFIQCNKNIGSTNADITSTSGVIPNQGGCSTPQAPANNLFSHNGHPDGDIKVATAANSFIYSFNPNPPAGLQIPVNYTTTKVTANSCNGITSFNYTTLCLSKLNTGCGISCQKNLIISNGQLAATASQVLVNGNAGFLYTAINSSMSAGSLKNLLDAQGGYLSDGVLIAYLQRPATPPAGHIKDVVIANSPVTAPVKSIIDNMSLPNGIRNQINAAQTGISARAQQEALVQTYEAQKQVAINTGVGLLLVDTTIANVYNEIESFLLLDNTLKGKIDLTNLYIISANYAKAQHLIDSLSSVANMAKYSNMLQHYTTLQQQNKTWQELQNDTQLKTDISTLAADSLANGFANARSALALVDGRLNYDLIEDLLQTRNLLVNAQENNADNGQLNTTNDLALSAYPNPFKDELNVFINTQINSNDAKLQLIEIASGKVIQEQFVNGKQSFVFNTAQLANGIYLVMLKGDGLTPSYIKVVNLK